MGVHAYGVMLNRMGTKVPQPRAAGIEVVNAASRSDLTYLLAETQMAAVLARQGCVAVRVPLPERFALHKLAFFRDRLSSE